MSRGVFLIDVDGVLADFVGAALRHIAESGGRVYAVDEIKTWEMFDSLDEADKPLREQVYARLKARGGCAAIGVYDGAKEGVAALERLVDVYAVTAPFWGSPTWAHEREEWLREHFGLPYSHVLHVRSKHLVRGDYLLDDKISHVVEWQRANPQGMGILWGQPYNKNGPVSAPRFEHWEYLVELVRYQEERRSRAPESGVGQA